MAPALNSIIGQYLFARDIAGETYTIGTSTLAPGIYYLRVAGAKRTVVKKITKN
jgi:hypothetical protein